MQKEGVKENCQWVRRPHSWLLLLVLLDTQVYLRLENNQLKVHFTQVGGLWKQKDVPNNWTFIPEYET